MSAGLEAQFGELQLALGVQCQRPVDSGQLQFAQLHRLVVAGRGKAQGGGAEFRHGGLDFALTLEAGQHALRGELGSQRFAGQIGDEGFQVGHLQLDGGRPGGFLGQRLANVAVQFQRRRAGDFLGQLQVVAQRAAQFAFASEIAVIRDRGAPVEPDMQRIVAGGRDLAIQPDIGQRRTQVQHLDEQRLGLGAGLQGHGVDLDGFGAGGSDLEVAALQIGDGECQRQPDVGQFQRLVGRRRVLAGRQRQVQAIDVQTGNGQRAVEQIGGLPVEFAVG